MSRSEPGLRGLLVPGHAGITDLFSADVQVVDLLLDEAALLHRDPRAERSRLLTRRFVAAAVSRWWDGNDPELLCAQIILCRFAGPHDATLSAADGWVEFAAGGALIDEAGEVRLAVLREPSTDHDSELVHAATFGSSGTVSYSVVASSPETAQATHRARLLAQAQIKVLALG